MQTCGYIAISKTNKQTNKQSIHSGERWNSISPAGEPECIVIPKQSLWSPTDEPFHFDHYFDLSPYLQLQNAKLNLSNFTVTLPFHGEINCTCTGWKSSLE